MKCYAQATSAGEVDLVMPTGRVTLTAEDGHRLLFHGATIVVGEFTLKRFKQIILVDGGGARYTADSKTLGALFRGDRARCKIYPAPHSGEVGI